MVPDLIWAPRSLGPKKFANFFIPVKNDQYIQGTPWKFEPCIKIIIWQFHERTKLLGDQTSRGPNFLGPKFLRDQISWWPKNSGAKMESGTISVVAGVCVQKCIFADLSLQIALSLPSFVRSKENTRYPWLFNE